MSLCTFIHPASLVGKIEQNGGQIFFLLKRREPFSLERLSFLRPSSLFLLFLHIVLLLFFLFVCFAVCSSPTEMALLPAHKVAQSECASAQAASGALLEEIGDVYNCRK